jgi:hypothetical protein
MIGRPGWPDDKHGWNFVAGARDQEGARFPDFATGATFKWKGKEDDFIDEETRQDFARQHDIPAE